MAQETSWESLVELPSNRGGQITRAWLDAYHSREPEQMADFHQRYRSAESLGRRSLEARLAQYEQIWTMLGALRVDEILVDEASELAVSVHSQGLDSWFKLSFSVQPEFPFKLETMSIGPGAPPDMDRFDGLDAGDLAAFVAGVRAKTGIPALAVAVIQDGRIAEIAFDGVRRIDGDEAVEVDDRYHIGSLGKSMTATMIAALERDGVLSMDTTVGEVLDDVEMLDHYSAITIHQLLGHRAGVPPYTLFDDDEADRLVHLPGTPTEQREIFVAQLLLEDPLILGEAGWSYSNGGYAVAGLMAERVTGIGYEELLSIHVFAPLGMENSGVGWPANPEHLDQPHGHVGPLDDLTVQEPDGPPFGAFLAPAGDIHCSLEDLASYSLAHLQAMETADGPLGEIAAPLHEPFAESEESYASGWLVRQDADWGRVDEHSGSAGSYFAHVQLEPGRSRAYVVLMNAGNLMCDAIARRVIEALRARDTAR